MNRFTPHAAAALTALLLSALPALAQDSAKTPRTVNRDELRVCMNSETGIGTRRTELDERAKRNRDEAALIKAEGEELATEQKRLEERQAPMERFDRKIKAYNARVTAARTEGDALRADYEALSKTMVAHNDKCGGIGYLKEDREAILKEREAAAPAPAAAPAK